MSKGVVMNLIIPPDATTDIARPDNVGKGTSTISNIVQSNDDNDDVLDQPVITLAPIIAKQETLIGKIASNTGKKIIYVLYTYINKSFLNTDNTISKSDQEKVYLTVNNSTGKFSLCNYDDGMLKLSPTLTKGALFQLNSEYKYFPIHGVYDHLDFESIVKIDGELKYKSLFYKLNSYSSRYNVTYCAENCSDNDGFCAQQKEDLTTNPNYQSMFNGYTTINDTKIKNIDPYNIKNYIKFKIEDANQKLVTPYFISMNPSQRIYFFTNKLAFANDTEAYYKLNTVPIYSDVISEPPYYESCKYEKDLLENNNLIYTKTNIHDIKKIYSPDDINEYNKKTFLLPEDTYAFKNDAYLKYALQFFIEELSDNDISKIILL